MNRKMLTMLHVYVQTVLKNQNRNLIEEWVIITRNDNAQGLIIRNYNFKNNKTK